MWTWAQQTLLVWTRFRRLPLHPLSSASQPSPPGPSMTQGAGSAAPALHPTLLTPPFQGPCPRPIPSLPVNPSV